MAETVSRRPRTSRPSFPAPSAASRRGAEPTIAAVVAPGERPSLDAASIGCFAVLHRNSIPEALSAVRERPVDAVVLSVRHCAGERDESVDHLVRDFPGVPTVALVTRHDPGVAQALLRLGATGVREAVDVTAPSGWSRLRQLIAEPATKGAARIMAPVFAALPSLPPDARIFLELLIREAPCTPVVRGLSRKLGLKPSTLMSRFARAGLPSPKAYLAAVRFLYAAQYFEGGGRSVSDVAYRLECSSPQSFGRSMRGILGITPGEFRRRFSFAFALDRFLSQLIEPYRLRWEAFRPLRQRPS